MKYIFYALIFLGVQSTLISQTNVSGGIYSNTTWTMSGSPYIVTGNVVVFDNVTLTIDPGVAVKFNDATGMEIRGTLAAIGTVTDTISFTSNSVAPWYGSWFGLTFTTDLNSSISYIKVEYANDGINTFNAVYASWSVTNSRFDYNNVGAYLNSGETNNFSYCKFDNNTMAIQSEQYSSIVSTDFINNTNGIGYLYDTYLTNCNFYGNTYGANSYRATITGCTFSYNWVGLTIKLFTQSVVQNNTFTYNNTGLLVRGDPQFPASVSGNTICANTYMNVENEDYISIDFRNNCWCSDDSAGIAAYIMDGYDNVSLGLIWYSPWTQCALGVDEPQAQNAIEVYPNPAQDQLQLSRMVSSAIIYDATGKVIMTETQTNSVDVSGLAPGIYLIELLDDAGFVTHTKFVKE